jgi:hypothetical protein
LYEIGDTKKQFFKNAEKGANGLIIKVNLIPHTFISCNFPQSTFYALQLGTLKKHIFNAFAIALISYYLFRDLTELFS